MDVSLYFLVHIEPFYIFSLFLYKFDSLDRKRTQHHRDGKQDLQGFFLDKKRQRIEIFFFFSTVYTTHPPPG